MKDTVCDIIFLNPFGFGYSGFSHGIATLSSILRDNGINVSVIDASAEKLNSEEVVLKVIREKPKIIGIMGFIQASFFNKEVSAGIKKALSEVVQLAGGSWAGYTPVYILRKTKIDYVVRGEADLMLASITSERGCYGRCDFYTAANLMRRNFSPQYLVEHMKYLMRTYNVNAFNFTESLTLSTRSWVKEFCNLIIDRKLMVFNTPLARADFNYDEETIKLLEDSGCIILGFGFESGDNLMLRSFNKKTMVERYYKIINDFKETSISVGGSFILNMPGENYDSIEKTIKFIKNTKIVFSYGFAYPYPGSSLYRFAETNSFCNLDDVMFKELNKRLPSRQAFEEYINKYNFNNLNKEKIWKVNKLLLKLFDYNFLYNKNAFLYFLVRIFPFCFEIKKGFVYLKNLIYSFLKKAAEFLKIKNLLKKLIHEFKFKK